MEFRDYWRVLWRRRAVVVPLIVVTFVASGFFNLVLPPVYRTDTTVHVAAAIPPRVPGVPEYFSPEYYRTIHSEYLADDLSIIVKSEDFAQKIADRLLNRYGDEVGVRDIAAAIVTTKRLHRTLKITIATGSEALTRKIAEAAGDVLRTDGARYFARGDEQPVQINVVDPPRAPRAPGPLRRLLDITLHTAVAAVVGVGLAFLLNYLDDRIQDSDDAARTLGWRVLGTVPPDDARPGPQAMGAAPAWTGLLARAGRKTPAA